MRAHFLDVAILISICPSTPSRWRGNWRTISILDRTYQRVGDAIPVSVQRIDPETRVIRWAGRDDQQANDTTSRNMTANSLGSN
jgi:hypothetical protein